MYGETNSHRNLQEWAKKMEKSLQTGCSKYQGYLQIAKEYGVHWHTVRYHLEPEKRQRELKRQRHLNRHIQKTPEKKTPTYYPELKDQWQKLYEKALSQGHTKATAYRTIGQKYGVCPSTIRYHLDSKRRWQHQERERQRYRTLQQKRKYQRNYKRLRRRPDHIFRKVFHSQTELAFEIVTEQVCRFLEDVPFQRTTIERLLNDYIKQAQGPPFIEQTEARTYRVCKPDSEDAGKGHLSYSDL